VPPGRDPVASHFGEALRYAAFARDGPAASFSFGERDRDDLQPRLEIPSLRLYSDG